MKIRAFGLFFHTIEQSYPPCYNNIRKGAALAAEEDMGESENTKDRRSALWRLLHWAARNFLARKFDYTYEQIECEAPCLIVSNHVTNNDPFFVGLAHKSSPLSYVASEHIFRLGIISKILIKLMDPIPRSKAASGAGTVKACLRRIKNGESIALFAEGDCTWDGRSAEVFPATGKLAKVCGAPLVTFRIEGGYLSSPRWAKKLRRGEMHGAPVHVYTVEELKGMTPEEVTACINRDIYTDAREEQKKTPTVFRSEARAEGLERALFICPCCGEADCMKSKKHRLLCEKCGAEWEMDEYGAIKGPKFGSVAEWDEWQKNAVRDMKGGKLFALEGTLTDIGAAAKQKTEVWLDADGGGIVFDGGRREPFSDITDMAMVKTNRLLFEDGEGYFEIKSKRGILRPYLMAWRAARGEKEA